MRPGVEGAGLDLVEIERLGRLRVRRPEFFARYFSPDEQARAEASRRPARDYARAFAAKEAFLKALGRGVLEGIPLRQVELTAAGDLCLGPDVRARMEDAAAPVHVTVAEDGTFAWAIVLVG